MIEFVVKYWIEFLFGAIISVIGVLVTSIRKRMAKQKCEQDAIKEGLLALLHDKIYNYCQSYLDRGYITVEEMRNLEFLYDSYKALGGNGTGQEIYERAKQLPIK